MNGFVFGYFKRFKLHLLTLTTDLDLADGSVL